MGEGDSYIRGEIMKVFELWTYFNILKRKLNRFYNRIRGDILSEFMFLICNYDSKIKSFDDLILYDIRYIKEENLFICSKNMSFGYLQNNVKVNAFYTVFHNINDMKQIMVV